MTSNSRTINTLAACADLDTLRAEVDRAISEMEINGISTDDLSAELVRLGAAIALPTGGPIKLMAGLAALLAQLRHEFPNEWEAAKAQLSSAGSA